MGEALKPSPQNEEKTIEEIFTDACPYFMAIGMTYEEFWYQDPHKAKMFLKAHEIRQKQVNEHSWLLGYYNYIALCCASPVLHAFAKQGTKPIDYPNQPLSLSKEENEQKEQEARNRRILNAREKLITMSKRR